ncbi:SchA/CurD-like domain-containing protein [Lentzea jiangxiensis]|uniref:SchA/CurD like domain-containing protein n=1 Tax=Lentzea jiangxiensis TaxID=641025 RepID=A0A1H0VSJ1_9PSEU|nr:SchA/CurD-like domain-containing protein [Lentzea jiangxiensis]SDP81188.1 SchA/CurD like domain-containing protein [Lentzea jiangxiensis]
MNEQLLSGHCGGFPAVTMTGSRTVDRYALTFRVRAGSETVVAEILSGYAALLVCGPEPGWSLLERTSVFMAGRVVVRVVDITCPPSEAVRHLAGQPQVQAVEQRLRPHLVHDREVTDEASLRRFAATSVMRVASGNGRTGRLPRRAVLYESLPGHAGELARRLSGITVASGGTTVFRRRDLVVHLIESDDETPPVPLIGLVTPFARLARPMTLVTDRSVGAVA